MHDIDRAIIKAMNHSRRLARAQIAEWLRGARLLRRHGQRADADALVRHAADCKAWAGARPIGATHR